MRKFGFLMLEALKSAPHLNDTKIDLGSSEVKQKHILIDAGNIKVYNHSDA